MTPLMERRSFRTQLATKNSMREGKEGYPHNLLVCICTGTNF